MRARGVASSAMRVQFTKVLDLMDSYLDERGHRTCRIDGAVGYQERMAAMDAFNGDPDCFVFLLSTRAGGLGINLTSADTVVIYDSDWNPHQDMQVRRAACGARALANGLPGPVCVLARTSEGRVAASEGVCMPPAERSLRCASARASSRRSLVHTRNALLHARPLCRRPWPRASAARRPWTARTASARRSPCSCCASAPATLSR